MKIESQAAIVTGGASGLGEATARALAAQGARVAVLDRNGELAKKVAADIGGVACECDITDAASVTAALQAAEQARGPARILMNIAGIGSARRIVGKDGNPAPLEDFQRVVSVNLVGAYNVSRLFAAACAKLAPAEDEWEELSTSHARSSNAQALIDAAEGARQALEDDEQGALAALHRALAPLQAREDIEPEFKALGEVLASAVAQAADAAHSLSSYLRHADTDPQRLAELDARMGLWMSLARRYRRPPEELPTLLAGWQSEMQALDAAADLATLERAEHTARDAYMKEARALSKVRQAAAPKLAAAITEAMQGLGMKGGRFEVSLTPLAQGGRAGLEDVGFLVAGHAGSTPRPIGKVASDGELSRIALAIAVTTSRLGEAATLIFDEVDSGVGGAVAETVGRLMQQLGRDRQVLAVTHLPQVAACADHHLQVAKRETVAAGASGSRSRAAGEPRTESSVSVLRGDDRDHEIARMLGGERVSATTLAHAREMLGKVLQ